MWRNKSTGLLFIVQWKTNREPNGLNVETRRLHVNVEMHNANPAKNETKTEKGRMRRDAGAYK